MSLTYPDRLCHDYRVDVMEEGERRGEDHPCLNRVLGTYRFLGQSVPELVPGT